jgi:hypothetical protein
MDPCHTKPFVLPGVVIRRERGAEPAQSPDERRAAECCDYCGSPRLEWRKCKLICAACRQINKSCADL